MKPIESVVKSESSLLYRSGKLFRLKGGEVDAESNAMTTREHVLRRFILRASPAHRP